MKKVKIFFRETINTIQKIPEHHVAAYAAQSAFFFILSLIPIILLLMTLVQYTPVTKADVMTAVIRIFPASINTMLTRYITSQWGLSRLQSLLRFGQRERACLL